MKPFAVRTLALFLLVFGLSFGAKAQYVTIPDANFRAKLQFLFPSCFNGQALMDTTCTTMVNYHMIFINNLGITNLEGIQYFDSLKYLYCSVNDISQWPSLPRNLYLLNCSSNHLTSLPTLPSSLRYLYCGDNQLSSIGNLPLLLESLRCASNTLISLPFLPQSLIDIDFSQNTFLTFPTLPAGLSSLSCHSMNLGSIPPLPASLTSLNCSNNYLTSIPSLPNSLLYLDCANNDISALPPLPNSLFSLSCHQNAISQLPALPNSLHSLICISNNLTSLPSPLPTGLFELDCRSNPIANLPLLPNGLNRLLVSATELQNLPSLPNNLKELYCGYNYLTSLPPLPSGLLTLNLNNNYVTSCPLLPDSLVSLEISQNDLTDLPALPSSLRVLLASGNQLACLPILPASLDSLNIAGNPITCIPNLPPNFPNNQNYPLCQGAFNVCLGSSFCEGILFYDVNNDGVLNNGEVNAEQYIVEALPGNYVSATTASGFRIGLNANDTSTLGVVNAYPHSLNFVPSSYQVISNVQGLVPGNFDFALQYIPNIEDMEVYMSSTPARPGFNTDANIRLFNAGTLIDSPFLSFSFPPDWVVLNTSPQGTVNGNSITWQDTALAIFNHHDFQVQFNVPAFVPIGTPYTYTASVPVGNDVTPINNSFTNSGNVIGAFDPNDKSCNTPELNPGYDPEQEIIYTVRFQNTGNAPATTVIVRDTLSQNLRANTLRVVNASHNFDLSFLDYSRVISVIFPNINLVDSFANEPLSHGFVQFAVKPQPNLPIGTNIRNTANIYFDYNAPIRTNTVSTHIAIVSVPQLASNTALKIYPNPTNGVVRIEAPEPLAQGSFVNIGNLMGQTLRSVPCVGNGAEVSLDGLPAGVYSASVVSEGRVLYRGIIVSY